MSEIVAPGRQWVTAALEQIFLMMESLMMRSSAGDGESRTTPLGGALEGPVRFILDQA